MASKRKRSGLASDEFVVVKSYPLFNNNGWDQFGVDKSIFILNDDCLLHICSYLTRGEVLEFGFTCRRFASVASKFFRDYKILDLREKCLSFSKLERLMAVVGVHVKRIIYRFGDFPIDLLLEYCPNLEHIDFHYIGFNVKIEYWHPHPTFDNIKTLILKCGQITDEIGYHFRTNKNLEILNLSGNRHILGTYWNEMPNLHTIILDETGFTDSNFIRICEGANHLKNLSIVRMDKMTKTGIDAIAKHYHCLEELSIDNRQMLLIDIEKFVNLKSIQVSKCSYKFEHHMRFWQSLSDLKLEKLIYSLRYIDNDIWHYILQIKTLKMLLIEPTKGVEDLLLFKLANSSLQLTDFGCPASPVNDWIVIELILKMPTIQRINLNSCSKLSCNLVLSLLPKLKVLNRSNKILLNVCNTKVAGINGNIDPICITYDLSCSL